MVDRVFYCKKMKPYIQFSIEFMIARVKDTDKHDCSKIKSVMKYLKGTQDIWLNRRADNSNIIKLCIDSAHAVHNAMRG